MHLAFGIITPMTYFWDWIEFCSCVNIFGQNLLLLHSKETAQGLSLVVKEMVAFFYQEKLTEELPSAAVLLFFLLQCFQKAFFMLLWVAPGASGGWGVLRHFLYFESTCGCLSIYLHQDLQALFQQRFDSIFKCHTFFISNEYAVFSVYIFTNFCQSAWAKIKTVFLFSIKITSIILALLAKTGNGFHKGITLFVNSI